MPKFDSMFIERLEPGFLISAGGNPQCAFSNVDDMVLWLLKQFDPPQPMDPEPEIEPVAEPPSDKPQAEPATKAVKVIPEPQKPEPVKTEPAKPNDAFPDGRPSDLTANEHKVMTALDKLALKTGGKQVCISFSDLAGQANVKKGSIHYICEKLKDKNYLKKIYKAGNDAAPVFTLSEGWE